MIEHLRDKGLGVGFACRVLGLSESAYYVRKKRPKSARRLRDEQLMPLIEQVHAESGGTYGVRRITRALRRKGVHVARCTVERLMAELGLEGVIRGRLRRTTVPEPAAPRQHGKEALAEQCRACPLVDACGAGYLPHRFSQAQGYRNPSVYCADLEYLIRHVQGSLRQHG